MHRLMIMLLLATCSALAEKQRRTRRYPTTQDAPDRCDSPKVSSPRERVPVAGRTRRSIRARSVQRTPWQRIPKPEATIKARSILPNSYR